MLLRFTVENAYCFNSEASLSMIATGDDRHKEHVIPTENGRRPAVLRAAALYGANGHGKSNFVNAVIALRKLVVEQKWSVSHFKLDTACDDKPSRMVIEFRQGELDYEYGVLMDGKVVAEEWLFQTDRMGRESKLFERASAPHNGGFKTTISSGPKLNKSASPASGVSMSTYIDVFASGMKESRPFLSEAEERGIEILQPAYYWFQHILTPVAATASYGPLFERAVSEDKFRCFLEDFMRQCDVGIEKINADSTKVDSAFSSQLPKELASQISSLEHDAIIHVGGPDGHTMVIDHNDEGDVVLREISALRKNNKGELVEFGFDEESSGTRRLLDLAPMLSDPDDHRVYVVDELDRKLHPMLAYQFVEAFLNTTELQLIFTTHNTSLMSLDLLRRDEVWFVQKRSDGSSDLYSLADLKVRPDLNIRKGYLSGRFGAIPFLGNAVDLGWSADHDDFSCP